MTKASTKMAAAKPRPTSLMTIWPPKMNDRNTRIMISAAAVMTRPVSAWPTVDGPLTVAGADPFLVHAADQEDLVVHRQAEEDGEHQHRQEHLDGPGLGEARAGTCPSPTGRPPS